MNKDIFIVLDIGTSFIKCGCVTMEHKVLVENQRKFPMIQTEDTFEIDFELFFDLTKELIASCIFDSSVQSENIEALLITSQANTFVPVNTNFEPLRNGIVWLDERAQNEADYLKDQLPDYSMYAGFSQPFPGLMVSKLAWLRRQEPAIFKKAKYFPLINEYVSKKLTNKFYGDTTSFGMSGLYNYKKNILSKKTLRILKLTNQNFPQLDNAATRGELISQEIANEWNLKNSFPVFLCGNDQCASASGSGLKNVGDISINFGSAMVLFTITHTFINDLSPDQIAGKYPIGDDYFSLNYESDFGIKIKALKEKLFKDLSYDQLFQTYLDYPEVEVGNPDFLMGDIVFNSIEETNKFCAGIIKYYLKKLKQQFTLTENQVNIKNIYLSGGMTKSAVWIKIIKKELRQTIIINNQSNAGLLGALNIYLSNKL